MADDDGAAGEAEQRVLEGSEGFDVEVVGRFVEQQQVAALLEGEGEVEAVAFTTGQDAGLLLLVGALEPELRDVGACGDLDLADLDVVVSFGDDLEQSRFGVDAGAVLVDVADVDRLTDLHGAGVWLFEADDRLEQGRLADAVGADDADDAVARQRERQPVDEDAVAEALLEVVDLDDLRAEARARRDLDLLEVELAGALGFGGHLLVAREACLRLRLAGLRVGADPLEFFLEALGELRVLLALDGEALLLLLEVRRVVALVRVETTAVDLADPAGDVVEEVPVVGDGEDGARVARKVLFEPEDGFGVEVVGGLVEQEKVGLLQQQLAQRDAALLTTGEDGDIGVTGRAAQGVHGLLELGVDVPRVGRVDLLLELAHLLHEGVEVGVGFAHLGGDLVEPVEVDLDLAEAFLDVAAHVLLLVERWLLQQDADAVARGQACLAVAGLVEPRHDLEDGGLAGAVGADDADLGAGVERHRHVVEDHLVANGLARLGHGVDELSHAPEAIGCKPFDATFRGACGARRPPGRAVTCSPPGRPRRLRRRRARGAPRWLPRRTRVRCGRTARSPPCASPP